ncbi:hypothetical protein AVEN_130333-1 [Araneus ventricosus]|uniref:Uncharacterized protein n=1 Tax=Araneus ventricosus TaxID=182803 RepID=A0A4Y2BDT8_ARAVE|nr:hypothetical protein AVEN_130333-1 [Araneus ventricosus]
MFLVASVEEDVRYMFFWCGAELSKRMCAGICYSGVVRTFEERRVPCIVFSGVVRTFEEECAGICSSGVVRTFEEEYAAYLNICSIILSEDNSGCKFCIWGNSQICPGKCAVTEVSAKKNGPGLYHAKRNTTN